MENSKILEILAKHEKWLNEEEGGERADFSSADLGGTDLSYADLSYANFSGANLYRANFSGANLYRANFSGADLSGADLSGANLSGADLYRANFSGADLSCAKGLLSPIEYISKTFETTEKGIIVYKTFGWTYPSPTSWVIDENSIISEIANFDRTTDCGCGINVATLDWIKLNVENYVQKDVWKCFIRWEWLCGVCVPYNTDGKIRCERLELLEKIDLSPENFKFAKREGFGFAVGTKQV